VTPLSPTEPEPLCDIMAQLAALLDPAHPKRAVWVSIGTLPVLMAAPFMGIHRLDLDAGTLYASEHDCGRLADDPSEETLSVILGYTEPKSGIIAQPAVWWPVVQARDAQGCVVWEQIASWQRVDEAMAHAGRYGRRAVCTMDEVLQRRARLIAEENPNAKRLQG
jgi:hypothetical protein